MNTSPDKQKEKEFGKSRLPYKKHKGESFRLKWNDMRQ